MSAVSGTIARRVAVSQPSPATCRESMRPELCTDFSDARHRLGARSGPELQRKIGGRSPAAAALRFEARLEVPGLRLTGHLRPFAQAALASRLTPDAPMHPVWQRLQAVTGHGAQGVVTARAVPGRQKGEIAR